MNREEILQVAKPILFNTEMVRAILDGRKTVTRRAVKPIPRCTLPVDCQCFGCNGEASGFCNADDLEFPKQPYQSGDILYVRETWKECCRNTIHSPLMHDKYCFKASLYSPLYGCIEECDQICKWRPSIHMPKEAARIFLRVTDVKVERLQEITIDGMLKEGVIPENVMGGQWQQWQRDYMKPVWDSTIKKPYHGRYGWDVNPWVWAIEFGMEDAKEND